MCVKINDNITQEATANPTYLLYKTFKPKNVLKI